MPVDAKSNDCPIGPPLCGQRFAAQFAIWAARIWVDAVKRGGSTTPLLDQAFAAANASAALPHLRGLFRTLATAATRSIDIRCPTCIHTSPDELALIRLIGAFQSGHFGEGAMLVSDWLPPAAARLAIDQALAYATALARAELLMGQSVAMVQSEHRHPAAAHLH